MLDSNEVLKCLYERGSVRRFQDKDISAELMKVVLDAGCHAIYCKKCACKSVILY